ncbi:MAG: hypothetical protein HY744_24780 [Deltaproteobacteria bacterium]|nr:hypothetical protein [Deltaproteobacteria bacterium]
MAQPVRVEDPERMNLLGLLLKGFLEERLAQAGLARRARRLRGAFGVGAGRMAVTLCFDEGGVRICKGLGAGTRACVSGPMDVMIRLVAGGGGLVAAAWAVLSGGLRIRGNPLALLGLLPVMLGRPRRRPALPAASEAGS